MSFSEFIFAANMDGSVMGGFKSPPERDVSKIYHCRAQM